MRVEYYTAKNITRAQMCIHVHPMRFAYATFEGARFFGAFVGLPTCVGFVP